MNNGKVRIYELSRELNLENKDILTICDRLNIAVKSHSSTITEDEANQIRAAAKQSRNGSAVANPPRSASQPQKPVKVAGRPVRKQQILEIRRHKASAPKAAKPPEAPKPVPPLASGDVSAAAVTSAAPTPPTKPQSAKDGNDSLLQQPPARPSTPKPSAKIDHPQAEPEPSLEDGLEDSSSPAVADSNNAEDSAKPQFPGQPKPQLVAPPSRATAQKPEKPEAKGQSSAEAKRPPARKSDDQPADRQARRPVPIREIDADADSPEVRRPVPIREVEADEVSTPRLKLKPKPKLRRPNQEDEAPDKTDKKADDDDDAKDLISVDTDVDTDEPILRRPSPPRHKRKVRDDEDDEQELRNKAGKVNKSKRRAQPVLEDEEEELEEIISDHDDSEAQEASHLKVSLARPPKPKKQSSPKPATPTVRSHKPSSRDGGGSRSRRGDRREQAPKQERPEILVLTEGLTVHELAERIMVPETELIKSLFFKGIAANINQTLDIETAKMVAEEFDVLVETAEAESKAKKTTEMLDAEDLENLQQRPPVVTIMGHVDHGKTTLLDAIRKTKVAQGEAGGITQHIGAYHVDVEHNDQNHQIVFLDTPGHEAFTAMRARGTRVTDIAILVVAADDGVRPQTIEAISHARAAEVPLLVAINKIDKETAQPDRVKQELMEHGLVPEEWGGDTIMVPVSALGGENLDSLLEMIVLVAEVEDLHANPDRAARGTVIEANLDKARGPVATLLVQNGTLRVGDSLVAGPVLGKVRAMIDDRGQRVDVATPSFAVEVLGLNDVPAAGDEFEVYPDEKSARAVADKRATEQRQSRLQQAMASRRVTLNSLSAQAQEGDLKELNLLLKADVQGSVEAILAALQQLPQNEVQIRVLLAAPGEISETDVDLAAASGAVIVGFNTTLASGARQAADRLGVDVRDYEIIYNLLDDIQGAMEGLLDPELVEEPLGQVEVRAVFPVRKGAVAGSYVLSGKVTRNCNLRVVRNGEVIYTGKLDSLKRMKEDAKEVAAGFECGIGVDNFNDWKEGDIIDAFKLVTKRRTLAMA